MRSLNLDKKLEIIAEVGLAHEGSLGMAHSYIDSLHSSGIDFIKFQIHIAEEESSVYEPFRIEFSYEDETRYQYWKRTQFNFDQWREIKKHCETKGITFLASPFSLKALEWVELLGLETIKIGSADVQNPILINRLCNMNKRLILSSGFSSEDELKQSTYKLFDSNVETDFLYCVSKYPTSPSDISLNKMKSISELFPYSKVGFSDHSGEKYTSIAAVALGAEILEFHVCYDKKQFGPDSIASIPCREVSDLVDSCRKTLILNSTKENDFKSQDNIKLIFSKSIIASKDINEGEVISFENLDFRKMGGAGIDVKKVSSFIGKKARKNIKKADILYMEDLVN